MTPNEDADVAVIMPLTSVIAMGAGAQGRAALATWGGLLVDDFERGFSDLMGALEADPETEGSASILRDVARAATSAHSWIHITTDGLSDERTCLVLQTADESLVLVIHGDIVEWVLGGHEVVSHCLAALLRHAYDSVTLLTCFVGDAPVAGLRFSDGAVEVTARSPELFDTLTRAAGDGLDSLGIALALRPDQPVST